MSTALERMLNALGRPAEQPTSARRIASDARELKAAIAKIEDLEAVIAAHESAITQPLRPIKPAALHPGRRPAVAVALLSDVHAEERVARSETIDNNYNLAIAERRVARFFAGTIWLIEHAARTAFDVESLVLWLGGDIISGDIHDELLERCEVPPAEATLITRDWIVAGIQQVLAAFPDIRIHVPCSYGNHSRTTKKMRSATGYGHSWEWLAYQIIAAQFADQPRVQFSATKSEMQFAKVFDFDLAFHHGHRMRFNGGVGGITVPATKQVFKWQEWKRCDYYNFGHFHTRLDLGLFAFNGSVVGPNPYAHSIGAPPEAPMQSFYLLDAKRGKTMSCPIWVAE